MKTGYLAVHTHDAHPGRVRLVATPHLPAPPDSPPTLAHIRFVARFHDSEAAMMHVHEILKRRLLDPDAHLYRTGLPDAIAAIASLDLRHEIVYTDPDIDTATRDAIDAQVRRNIATRRHKDRFFETMGWVGIGILIFNLLFLSFV